MAFHDENAFIPPRLAAMAALMALAVEAALKMKAGPWQFSQLAGEPPKIGTGCSYNVSGRR